MITMRLRIPAGITLSVILLCSADSFAQSVADAARKERERQRAVQGKVLFQSAPATTAGAETAPPAAAPAPATATTTAPKPVEVKDNKGRDEKYWRSNFQKARDDLKRAEAAVELLDLKLKELNTQLLRQSDVFNRENRIGPEITATQRALEDARQAAEDGRKKIIDLEDELRRSGGPAGWAR